MPRPTPFAAAALLLLAACNQTSNAPWRAGYGPDPKLAAAKPEQPIPTLNAAKAVGWPPGAAPKAPPGFAVARYAEGLDHPRWLYLLPNGDVLVAETNSPPREAKGIEGRVQAGLMKRGGAAVPSANRITLLRDADGDGRAEVKSVFLQGLNSPFGMALVGDRLFVANTDSIVAFPYQPGQTRIGAKPEKIADLPANPPNNHWARNLIASPDGQKLYVTVGSDSNVAEGGLANEKERANVLVMGLDGSDRRVFASGTRNPNGLAWEPKTGVLWVTVNERDMLGPDVPPDYMTGLKDGAFYGWPYSYFGGHPDPRVKPQRPDLVAKATRPDYALGAHTASLGLAFYTAEAFPPRYRGGAFVGQHGSWNRQPLAGYKVVFVPFKAGRPAGAVEDFLTGFLNDRGEAQGRPVGVIQDRTGAVLVADDVGDLIWRISPDA